MFISKMSKYNLHKITCKDAEKLAESILNIPNNIHTIKLCTQIIVNLFL